MNYWFDMQKDFMQNWLNMGQSAQHVNPFLNSAYTNGNNANPWATSAPWAPWADLFAQQAKQMNSFWAGNGQRNFNWFNGAWVNDDVAESAKHTADKVLESQMFVFKMFENMAQGWMDAAQNGSLAQWQTELARQMEAQSTQMREQWDATMNQWTAATETSNQMWQTYLEQLQQNGMPWLNAWMASGEQTASWLRNLSMGQATPPNLMGQFWTAYEETFGKMVSSPPLGLTRELNLELTKGFETWLAYRRADAEYQRVVGSGWMQFLEAFGKRLMQMAQAGKLIESPRQFVDLWVEVGDDEFTKLFHGDAYAQAQGNLVNSSMAFKRQQRALLEIWLRDNDMPTRSDLDEAHRTIHELRKDVKALKKDLHNLQQTVANTAAAAVAQKPATTQAAPKTKSPKSTQAKSTSRARTTRKSSASAGTQAGR